MGLWSLESWFESRPRNHSCRFPSPRIPMQRAPLSRRESKNSCGVEWLAGKQRSRRKTRVVRRIREMLTLQAKRGALLVHLPSLAMRRPVQKIPCIKLYPGLGRQDLQDAAALGIARDRRQLNRQSSNLLLDNPVVIVSPPK